MNESNDDLWRMLRQAYEMPTGAGKIAAVERLLRQVDAAGDGHLGFSTRMLATGAYRLGGEPAKSFVTFSWCLSDYDRNPQPYHQAHTYNLLWQFKWMISGLTSFPEIPLDRTYAVLDDMERRYREGGHSLQAVYKCRHRVARHLGAVDEAAHWYRLWTTTPRDDLSDCAGCDPSSQAHYLGDIGQDEAAIALAEPVLAGQLTCPEQPHGILTSLLLPYLRTGRRDAARDAHRQAYRSVRGNVADLWDVGEHVEFCALTGNDSRGLELIERHLEWLDRPPYPSAAMDFAASAALVLHRLDDAGHGGLTVHRRAYGERPAADLPIRELATELAGQAREIAARFDARNGTSEQSRWVDQRMSREPIGPHLPLSATRRRPAASTGSTAAVGDAVTRDAATADPAGSGTPRRPAPLVPPAEATPLELLQLAEECWRTDRRDDLLAVLRTFDDRFGTSAPNDPLIEARRVEFRSIERRLADDLSGAQAAHREAITLYQRLPDLVREWTVAGRLGVLLCMTGEADEGLALAREALAVLTEHGTIGDRADAYDRLASALIELERVPEALEAAERAVAAADEADDPYQRVRVGLRQTQCLELLERPREEVASAALRVRDLCRELGMSEYHAAACMAYGRSLTDPADAVAAFTEAVGLAGDESVLPARIGRARSLLAAGRPGEAIDDFVEAVALCAERDLTEPAAYLRWELAGAYRQVDQSLDAAEAAEEAVAELDRLGHQADADRCRHLLANVYVSLDQHELALALLDQLADNLDGPDNLGARGQVLEEAGDLLYRQDRDSLAAERFAAAAESYRLGELTLDELRARRRQVDALYWAGEVPAAVHAVEIADEVLTRLGDEAGEPGVVWERGMLAHGAARVLFQHDQPEAALGRLGGVPEELRSIQSFGEATQIELFLGEVLLRLDRPAEAEPLLRRVLGGLPESSGLVQRAAWLLSRALEALGRSAEAEALRAQHDLEPDE